LERITAECKYKIEKAEKLASQSQKNNQEQTDTVNTLVDERNSSLQLSKSLKSELSEHTSKSTLVLKELNSRIELLTPKDHQLSVSPLYYAYFNTGPCSPWQKDYVHAHVHMY